MSNWLTLKKNRSTSARYLPLEKGYHFKSSEMSLFSEPLGDSQSTVTENTITYQLGEFSNHQIYKTQMIFDSEFLGHQPREIASVVGHLMEEKGKLECVVQQVNFVKFKCRINDAKQFVVEE
jgi:hypothetical protein